MFRVGAQRSTHLLLSRPSATSSNRRSSALRADSHRSLRPGQSSHGNSTTRTAIPRRVFSSSNRSVISLPVGISAGGLAGVLAALSGVGGGMVLIPTLAKLTTLPIQIVKGTCVGALMVSAGVGAWNYYQADSYNLPLVIITAIPSMVFTRVGVGMARRITSKQLSTLVGMGMLAAVPCVIFRAGHPSGAEADAIRTYVDSRDLQYYNLVKADTTKHQRAIHALHEDSIGIFVTNAHYMAAGAAAGMISGLCGTGGGILSATYLVATTNMPQPEIIGTTLISILPTALASTYYNYRARAIHAPTAVKVGVAVALSAHTTTTYILRNDVSESFMRGTLSTSLTMAAVTMLRRPL